MSSSQAWAGSTVVVVVCMVGCTAVEPPIGAATTATTGGAESTSTDAPASTSGPGTTNGTTASVDTTGDPDDDGSSSDDDGAGFLRRPDGGVPSGFCVGRSAVGHLATVHADDDVPVDPTCSSTPTPCGGDIVGTWTIQSHCGLDELPSFFEHECPGSTMEVLGSDVQGTRTFADDFSYEQQSTLVLDVEVLIDTMTCFGVDCESFGELLEDAGNDLTAVCSESAEAEACSCLLMITDQRADQGTYEITEDGVVLTVKGIPTDPIPHCATGDRLELWEPLYESRTYPRTPCLEAADCEAALGDAYEEWLCIE